MLQHLLQYHARIQRDLLVLVPRERREDDLALARRGHPLDGRPPRADLPPEEVVEDLDDVLARLEFEAGDVLDEEVQEVGVVGLLGELGDEFRGGVAW